MLIIIAALTRSRVIGKDGRLPWHISEEIRNFKRLTTGNTVIMGRKTFESIGRPLPNRNNIVISRSLAPVAGVDVCRDLESGLAQAKQYGRDIYVIGGATLYEQTLARADKMYLSYVRGDYAGDTYFPEFNDADWISEEKIPYTDFDLFVYARKR